MTRRSARIATSQSSQPDSSPSAAQSSPPTTSNKRKAESGIGSSPSAKRGKKDVPQKAQSTIEESMNLDKKGDEHSEDKAEDEETEKASESNTTEEKKDALVDKQEEPTNDEQANGRKENSDGQKQLEDDGKVEAQADALEVSDSKEPNGAKEEGDKEESKEPNGAKAEGDEEELKAQQQATDGEQKKSATNGQDAVDPSAREGEVPSSILEKGILYFFYRGRVNIEEPSNVEDIARSYLVLRPLPHDAKLGDGPIGDDKNCRLIAIPKKMLPLSGNDRWIAFVETSNASLADLKEGFMNGEDYTAQAGNRHTPAATPAAEGIYAITTTGRESHIAYMITLPEELGEVQNALGLRSKGSFVVSVKNPKAPGPANTNIGKDPGYNKELQNEFRSLRWAPMKAEHLDYEGCQFLMIGEGEQGINKATEQQAGDEKKKETPMEEMQKLEEEDEMRVEHLNGEDAVFADLGTNAKNYPKLHTTW